MHHCCYLSMAKIIACTISSPAAGALVRSATSGPVCWSQKHGMHKPTASPLAVTHWGCHVECLRCRPIRFAGGPAQTWPTWAPLLLDSQTLMSCGKTGPSLRLCGTHMTGLVLHMTTLLIDVRCESSSSKTYHCNAAAASTHHYEGLQSSRFMIFNTSE